MQDKRRRICLRVTLLKKAVRQSEKRSATARELGTSWYPAFRQNRQRNVGDQPLGSGGQPLTDVFVPRAAFGEKRTPEYLPFTKGHFVLTSRPIRAVRTPFNKRPNHLGKGHRRCDAKRHHSPGNRQLEVVASGREDRRSPEWVRYRLAPRCDGGLKRLPFTLCSSLGSLIRHTSDTILRTSTGRSGYADIRNG